MNLLMNTGIVTIVAVKHYKQMLVRPLKSVWLYVHQRYYI